MNHATSYAILAPILLFALYRRVARTIGPQRLVPLRLWLRIGIFSVLCAAIALNGLLRPLILLADAAGAAAGAILAVAAMRSTVFERRDDGLYYRTHTWIGLAVSALFLVRLAYRFVRLQALLSTAPGAAAEPAHLQFGSYSGDPLTAGLYFLVAAYYVVYYGLLLRGTARTSTPSS